MQQRSASAPNQRVRDEGPLSALAANFAQELEGLQTSLEMSIDSMLLAVIPPNEPGPPKDGATDGTRRVGGMVTGAS